jgi:hypothetical protein
MGKERRKSKRFMVVDLDVYMADGQERIGRVVNLSEGGLLMVAERELPSNEIVRFSIPFTHTVNGEIKFDFNARIVWCYPNTLHSSKFSVGMEFAENPDLQSIFIQQMIKVYGTE